MLIDGWRWLLIAGGLGAAVVWALRRNLPESPRWQEISGDREAAEATVERMEEAARQELGLASLPEPGSRRRPPPPSTAGGARSSPPSSARRSVMLCVFQVLQTVGYYGFGSLAPLVLASKGFDIVSTLGYAGLIFVGYPVGSAASIVIVERLERKLLIIASALTMAALGVVFGFATAPAAIIASGFLLTAASNVFSNAYHIYQAEIFPTRIRASAVGGAYSLSRLTGALLPFLSVAILDGLGRPRSSSAPRRCWSRCASTSRCSARGAPGAASRPSAGRRGVGAAVDHDPLAGEHVGGGEEADDRATSSGRTMRPSGWVASSSEMSSRPSLALTSLEPMSVTTRPGATMLTRMPLAISSWASVNASASSAALAMLYGAPLARIAPSSEEEMAIMSPRGRSRIAGQQPLDQPVRATARGW